MDALQAILEKRKELRNKIYQFRDEITANSGKFKDADHRAAWEKVNQEYNDLGREEEELRSAASVLDTANRAKEEDDRQQRDTNHGRKPGMDAGGVRDGKGKPTEEERALAMAAFCRSAMGGFVSDEDVDVMRRCRISPNQRQLVVNLSAGTNTRFRKDIQSSFSRNHASRALRDAESRAMSGLVFADGGALVPESFMRNLEINMVAFGGVRQVADTLTTSTGERMMWPTGDDTSNEGEMLGESASVGTSVEPSFGGVYWDAYKFSSKPILVPYELLEDSFMDLPSVLGQMMGERLGRTTARKHTTGTGANEPKGIVTNATLGYTAASATAITYDEVIRLEHSVDPAYRVGAGYMCHDNIVLALRLLKDGDGKYLWQSGIDNNSPDRLNGHPLTVSMEMASSIVSGAKTLLWGQLSRHKIRRVNQIRMYRLEERYRENDQDGFIALLREDSNTLTSGTSPIKYLVH